MDKSAIETAQEEMDYRIVDNGVIEMPSAKPAAFSFVGEPILNPDGFESVIDEYNFSTLTPDYDSKDSGEFYYYVDVMTDHFKKVHIKVWKDSVRVYPNEELPDTYEFARIIDAIEAAFGAHLEHDPIED